MNKKQVGALLKVMSKDETRPILCTAKIDVLDGKTVLVATDGYKLAAVNIMGDIDKTPVGLIIRREAIERWYKLATGKSRLTADELDGVISDDYGQHGSYVEGNYPEWKKMLPVGEPEGQSLMAFNADFFKTVQDLDGENHIRVKLYGRLKPMVMESERGTYVVMPMRK